MRDEDDDDHGDADADAADGFGSSIVWCTSGIQ